MAVVMMPRDRDPQSDRESWTDDRVDDLSRKVDEGFRRVDEGFKEMREEFRAVRAEIAADRRTMLQVGGAIWVTSLIGFLGVIVKI